MPCQYAWNDLSAVYSHPEVFGQELTEWDGETAEELAGCMLYRRRSWRGILPVNHLAQWALTHKVTDAASCLALPVAFLLHATHTQKTVCFV